MGVDTAVNISYPGGWEGVYEDIIVPLAPKPTIDTKAPVIFIDSPIDTSFPDKLLDYNHPAI